MASEYATTDEGEEEFQGLIILAKNAALRPFRIIFSKSAQRAYLTAILVTIGSLILLGLAITAYVLFYWSYIPRVGFERPIHLQFDYVSNSRQGSDNGANPHPYGIVILAPDLVSAQRYDVSVELKLPRTRENRDAGNFMIEANMYAAGSIVDAIKDSVTPGSADEDNKLATSRRPAMLTYRSPVVEHLWKLTELHWYLLRWREEAEKMTVSIFEGVEFAKGWRNLPSTMKLEIQSTHRMQIYSAKATFKARFRGLRWLMYNHRLVSAAVFITFFWTTEVVFAGLAWAALSFFFTRPTHEVKAERVHEIAERIKSEPEEDVKPVLSDTERTFPTSSKQQPLRYESPRVKREEDEDTVVLPDAISKAAEADDEDDEADTFLDSGLGTSMESSGNRRDSVRKRRGRTGSGDGKK